MLVYLTHPLHGVHIAYSDAEVKLCLKNGWTVKDAAEKAAEPVERVKRKYVRKS